MLYNNFLFSHKRRSFGKSVLPTRINAWFKFVLYPGSMMCIFITITNYFYYLCL